jgi:hypothetical protein
MKKMNTQFYSKKTKIKYAKKHNEAHTNKLKEEILQVFQDNKNKEYEKTQKQINEFIGALNKHQSETEKTISTEINELKVKIDNIEDEVTHNMENLKKRNETEIQNTMEGHSSILEQAENRISELEDEMEIKGKLKTY